MREIAIISVLRRFMANETHGPQYWEGLEPLWPHEVGTYCAVMQYSPTDSRHYERIDHVDDDAVYLLGTHDKRPTNSLSSAKSSGGKESTIVPSLRDNKPKRCWLLVSTNDPDRPGTSRQDCVMRWYIVWWSYILVETNNTFRFALYMIAFCMLIMLPGICHRTKDNNGSTGRGSNGSSIVDGSRVTAQWKNLLLKLVDICQTYHNKKRRRLDRTALSGIAVQHADDGYSRRGNFGGSFVRSMVLIYSTDGTKVWFKKWGDCVDKFDRLGWKL